jgi:tripartite-type tricarboxylate transporter receptor subunit TctC
MEGSCRSSIRFGLLATVLMAATAVPTFAAERYPTKPIRLVCPFSAGGSTDFNARAIQDKLTQLLGEQVVIDNRAGASGQIGTRIVKDSNADGYSLVLHTVAFLTSTMVYKNAGYVPFKDFKLVAMISKIPTAISVHPSVPAKSVKELVALAKSRPANINYASSGVGTNSHLTGELFNLMANVNIRAIQYKGGGPALAAVVSGEMQVGFSNITNTARLHEAGRLRALAVSSLKRSSAMPDLPTVAESGMPGFEMVAWHIVAAPAGTPDRIITLLNQKIQATLADPVVMKRFDRGGAEIIPMSPQQVTSYLKEEQVKWRRVVRERKITAGARR